MSVQVKSQTLDHLGIIAGVCKDLNLASVANSYLEKRSVHPKVTAGDAIVALILNGLGFVTRSLYMTSTFFETRVNHVYKYHEKGRPQKNAKKNIEGFQIEVLHVTFDEKKFEVQLNKKGRFIVGTNEINDTEVTDEMILNEYKSQQDVERGFRFIKDPSFGVSDVFLKSPRRIMALAVIMTLCLMVYNIAQFEFREVLKTKKEVIPNQLGKTTATPTLRLIFQLFQDIALVHIVDGLSKANEIGLEARF